jgi:hypothetical protein
MGRDSELSFVLSISTMRKALDVSMNGTGRLDSDVDAFDPTF